MTLFGKAVDDPEHVASKQATLEVNRPAMLGKLLAGVNDLAPKLLQQLQEALARTQRRIAEPTARDVTASSRAR